MDQSSNSVFKRHLSAASNSSSTSNWEPFQEERIKARAVPEETQNALANVGLRARMNVDRGYKNSLDTGMPSGPRSLFRTTTFISSEVQRTAPVWGRTQSLPTSELQPFAMPSSTSNLDPMEEEWILNRGKGLGAGTDGMMLDHESSDDSLDEEENRPIGFGQVKRGRDAVEMDKDDVLGRWAEEDEGQIPNLSSSSETLESTSFPPDSISGSRLPQRTISALPGRSFSPPSSKLGSRPLSRPTQSMPVSAASSNGIGRGYIDPYSGFGSFSSKDNLEKQRAETARFLSETSLPKMERAFSFEPEIKRGENGASEEKQMNSQKMDMDTDLQSWTKKTEGF